MTTVESTEAHRPSQAPSREYRYQKSQGQQSAMTPAWGLHAALSVPSRAGAGYWASLDPTAYAWELPDAGRACSKPEQIHCTVRSKLFCGLRATSE